ncbi:hypothetical protein PN441_05715 [Spirulina major CS-329]|uniref:hypothetical protein n=1 Tax=Spirulina TaxID=1154 RepID=UPI00232DC013|nr:MULTISPECIES: hypothetical protein [Spirulina]MDB9495370.1 hypothetical protein [Spirulina subsalsa CS-330]MDB9502563.1 hypothetical protein [Spirulina major CS-329]
MLSFRKRSSLHCGYGWPIAVIHERQDGKMLGRWAGHFAIDPHPTFSHEAGADP